MSVLDALPEPGDTPEPTAEASAPAPRPRKRRTSGDRKGGLPRWVKPAAWSVAAAMALLSPIWVPALLRPMDFFRVRSVEVVGARYVEARELVERLRVDSTASVWDDHAVWAARAAEHPMVRDVEIGRRLPGTIVVRVAEHVPVALVPSAAGFKAYDVRGVALPIDPAAADVDAPILARVDTAMLHLLSDASLHAPELYRRMSEIRPAAAGELVVMLDSLLVRAGADVTLQRLGDLAPVEQDLARRGVRPRELDLRFRDQVIARLQ